MSEAAQLVIVCKLEAIEIKPTDVLVVSTEFHLKPSQIKIFRERLKEVFPDNNAVILASGAKLNIARLGLPKASP